MLNGCALTASRTNVGHNGFIAVEETTRITGLLVNHKSARAETHLLSFFRFRPGYSNMIPINSFPSIPHLPKLTLGLRREKTDEKIMTDRSASLTTFKSPSAHTSHQM